MAADDSWEWAEPLPPNVLDLEDYREHGIMKVAEHEARVFPLSMLQEYIDGKIELDHQLLRAIVKNWMTYVTRPGRTP